MTDKPEPCEGCECGLAAGIEIERDAYRRDSTLNQFAREYLEAEGYVEEDDIIKRIEICPDSLVIHREDRDRDAEI